MGQLKVKGPKALEFLELATVCDVKQLKPGFSALTLITNEQGGIKDDCILTKVAEEEYLLVLNAGCKEKDVQHLQGLKPQEGVDLELIEDKQLIAVQGPQAHKVLQEVLPSVQVAELDFMQRVETQNSIGVTRCGYTGEDGFELSIPDSKVRDLVAKMEALTDRNSGLKVCEWVGLGARDTLRLEAGLCLYGHELKEEITPVSAMLNWTISKRRRDLGGFMGHEVILKQLAEGNVEYKR